VGPRSLPGAVVLSARIRLTGPALRQPRLRRPGEPDPGPVNVPGRRLEVGLPAPPVPPPATAERPDPLPDLLRERLTGPPTRPSPGTRNDAGGRGRPRFLVPGEGRVDQRARNSLPRAEVSGIRRGGATPPGVQNTGLDPGPFGRVRRQCCTPG